MNQADLTKLYKSSREGNIKVIAKLLPQLDPKLPVEKDWLDRSLAQAVYGNSVAVVDILLKAGANPNQNTSGGTLLAFPAGNGDLPMVKRLIEGGADCNREFKRETALSAALAESQIPIVEYLETLGAYSPPNETLFYACANGDIERAKKALAEGAEVRKTGGTLKDETPLMVAARKGHTEAVKLLLKHGADPSQRKEAKSALFYAVGYGKNLEVFELLVAAGADIRAKYYEETLLMTAAAGGCLPIVKRLVELGADVHARDKRVGRTALDYAKSRGNQAVIDYLNGLGARSDRAAGCDLMTALAREFGGKFIEHSHGFGFASKLAGNICRFDACLDTVKVVIQNLNFSDRELKRAKDSRLVIGTELSKTPMVEVKAAGKLLGVKVRMVAGTAALTAGFVTDFCRRHQTWLKQLNLSEGGQLTIYAEGVSFLWKGLDAVKVIPRLKIFGNFVQAITRPSEPERFLFSNEWLIKPAPKTGGAKSSTPHTLGGALAKPVTCPLCGHTTNLMAHIDLSDAALPKTALGRGKLPVFWCLSCLEWDAAFFDIARATPKPLVADNKFAAKKVETGEEALPERPVMLVPVPPGKKAVSKSKLGGPPTWIQSESVPDCPKCEKPMAFALQLASDSRISYCDMGMLYAFACPECKVTASLIQSH